MDASKDQWMAIANTANTTMTINQITLTKDSGCYYPPEFQRRSYLTIEPSYRSSRQRGFLQVRHKKTNTKKADTCIGLLSRPTFQQRRYGFTIASKVNKISIGQRQLQILQTIVVLLHVVVLVLLAPPPRGISTGIFTTARKERGRKKKLLVLLT